MKGQKIIKKAHKQIEKATTRGAWSHGVSEYAHELLDDIAEAIAGGYLSIDDLNTYKQIERAALNGASDWGEYSWGGCSLVYNGDIAERLCSPSEQKKTRNGERRPNAREEWLDTQARALFQACWRLVSAIRVARQEIAAERAKRHAKRNKKAA